MTGKIKSIKSGMDDSERFNDLIREDDGKRSNSMVKSMKKRRASRIE
jgi:hypothetical protein